MKPFNIWASGFSGMGAFSSVINGNYAAFAIQVFFAVLNLVIGMGWNI